MSTDSNPNTSPADGSAFPLGENKPYFTPMFKDRLGNTLVLLYADCATETEEQAKKFVKDNVDVLAFAGLRLEEVKLVDPTEEVQNVTCTLNTLFDSFKVAIIAGPTFDEHYNYQVAQENDRAALEARQKVANENLDVNAG